MSFRNKLIEHIRRDAKRLENKPERPSTMMGLLLYGGTLGLMFTIPIVGGAYLGRWLDALADGYSVRWTVSLILLGLVVGGYNVIRLLNKN